jgi:lactate dehydrogenase-like 2-hydroxyacid dehydrogenase
LLRPEKGELNADNLKDIDAIIHCRSRNKLSAEVLEVMPTVKIIVQAGVGTNHIDVEACSAKGIPVCNVPDYGTREIADHALALLLNLRRGITAYDERIRASAAGWSPFALSAAPIRRWHYVRKRSDYRLDSTILFRPLAWSLPSESIALIQLMRCGRAAISSVFIAH